MIIQTYWLHIAAKSDTTSNCDDSTGGVATPQNTECKTGHTLSFGSEPARAVDFAPAMLSDRIRRLVRWNVDILQGRLKHIMAERDVRRQRTNSTGPPAAPRSGDFDINLIEEVKDSLDLPGIASSSRVQVDPQSVVLPQKVFDQLLDFVTRIAMAHPDNAFHSFEHAR